MAIAGTRPLQHHLVVYRRTWRASAFSTVLAPILFLTAMGVGLGSFVGTTTAFGGVSYLAFLAPGLLAAQAMQTRLADVGSVLASGTGLVPVELHCSCGCGIETGDDAKRYCGVCAAVPLRLRGTGTR